MVLDDRGAIFAREGAIAWLVGAELEGAVLVDVAAGSRAGAGRLADDQAAGQFTGLGAILPDDFAADRVKPRPAPGQAEQGEGGDHQRRRAARENVTPGNHV